MEEIRAKYELLTPKEKEIFSLGRESVLLEFETMSIVDGFVGFSSSEWKAVQKFFQMNKSIRLSNNN